ncbi:MAG: hypothetical protein U5K84_10620 [Alkalibacterium sp.]|nr:hypothetical protein [Alkalibacterium sp.]
MELSVSHVEKPFTLQLRKPGWSGEMKISADNSDVTTEETNGYITLSSVCTSDTTFLIEIGDACFGTVGASLYVKEDKGKVAVQKRPVCYTVSKKKTMAGTCTCLI